jgi:acyl-CoA thioesterase
MENGDKKGKAIQVVDKMMEKDHFSAWLGLQVSEVREGYCRLQYTVTKDMLNGFDQVHGGVLFAASDSAFAFACNTHGILSVALSVSISFIKAVYEGEQLTVEAEELYNGRRTGLYQVRTTNKDGVLVSMFQGTAYRTSSEI